MMGKVRLIKKSLTSEDDGPLGSQASCHLCVYATYVSMNTRVAIERYGPRQDYCEMTARLRMHSAVLISTRVRQSSGPEIRSSTSDVRE